MKAEIVSEEWGRFMENRLRFAAVKAANALSQMLNCKIDVDLSSLHLVALSRLSDIFDGLDSNVQGIRMNMFGDVKGDVFFLIREKDRDELMRQVAETTFGKGNDVGLDISIIEEVGNIIAGVYLTAIYEISGLNIYHSIPSVSLGIFSSLIDESIARESMSNPYVVVIENQFSITKNSLKTFFLVIPSAEFVSVLFDALERSGNRKT